MIYLGVWAPPGSQACSPRQWLQTPEGSDPGVQALGCGEQKAQLRAPWGSLRNRIVSRGCRQH